MRRLALFLGLSLAITGSLTLCGASARTFEIDSGQSRALVQVGKSGPFSFIAGHTHEVEARSLTGVVHIDAEDLAHSDLRVEIDAAAMRVSGKGEPPEDVPKVQQVMLSEQVLDVQRYPKIVFESTSVSAKGGTATRDLLVTGRLTLHNVTRTLTVPVTARIDGNTLTATGRFPVKQTDYGIKPISVGGIVTVRDSLNITFTIIARERTGLGGEPAKGGSVEAILQSVRIAVRTHLH